MAHICTNALMIRNLWITKVPTTPKTVPPNPGCSSCNAYPHANKCLRQIFRTSQVPGTGPIKRPVKSRPQKNWFIPRPQCQKSERSVSDKLYCSLPIVGLSTRLSTQRARMPIINYEVFFLSGTETILLREVWAIKTTTGVAICCNCKIQEY